jgi:hypothetical protein
VIAALLNVADSRFQEALLAQAKAAGKIRGDYRIPELYRDNLPERLQQALGGARRQGFFSDYPFGTDLTAEEIALARALKYLEAHSGTTRSQLHSVTAALWRRSTVAGHHAVLRRMGLETPRGGAARLQRRLLLWALEATAAGAGR